MNKEMTLYFDKLAPGWSNAPDEYEKREKLLSMMGLPQGGVIADVGCGKGVMFEHLLKAEPEKIYAVDISGEMLRLAGELHSDRCIEYINDDFLDAPLHGLDAVIFFNSYPHFLDKAALAGKLSKVIKKGGTFIIAHSSGKAKINARHTGDSVPRLSVPLDDAKTEAGRFQKTFTPVTLVDNEEMFFVKMERF